MNISLRSACVWLCIAASWLAMATSCGRAADSSAQVQDPNLRKIVQAIEGKLAAVKGFKATAEASALSPNGGFERFSEEIAVRRPDRMLIKRTMLVTHNADAKGEVRTLVIDGGWAYSRIDRPQQPAASRRKQMEEMIKREEEMAGSEKNQPGARKMTDQEKEKAIAEMLASASKPSYSKTNLKAVERAGVMSIREYMSSMHNLLDPFAMFDMKTLKLERETPGEWTLLAEVGKKNNPNWPANRLVFDKKTGFLKKIEIEIGELKRTVVLLDVKSVAAADPLPDSLFKMEFPKSEYVMDDTDMIVPDYEEEMEK